ncbi:MFS transporter [Herbiconiux sp. CPCC 203406]|uniref:MFS transporter n=1 Tax=Herbiconiux oxytropis TaxID=2970915 RepID=UPI00217EFA02|nr:MFS transporter [Herbiconiux oxytropis]MCS5721835.1 MFS transporter [Herbiconiux oxytropis]
MMLSAFESSMVYVALPSLIGVFDVGADQIAWTVTVYLLVSASSAALGGRLGDLYGRRRVLIIVCILAGVGSIVSVVGGGLAMLILGRAIQGTAGAVFGLAFGLAREHLPSKRVPVAVSLIGGSALLAGAAGGLIAGSLLQFFGWASIFFFAALFAVVTVIVSLIVLPRDTGARKRGPLDLIGAVVMPVAISAILLAITLVQTVGAASITFIGLLAFGIAALIGWVIWELRVKHPIVNVRLFKSRSVAVPMGSAFLLALGPAGGSVIVLQIIQQYPLGTDGGLGLSPATAGGLGAIAAVLAFALSPVGGMIARRHGARSVFILAAALQTFPLLLVIFFLGNFWCTMAAVLCVTIGSALNVGAIANVLFDAVSAANSSEITGTSTTVTSIGLSAATAIAGVVLALFAAPETGLISGTGFLVSLGYMTVIGTLSVLLGFFIPKRKASEHPAEGEELVTTLPGAA